MIISNGVTKINTESEKVLQATEYYFDSHFYREVEGFGAIRYSLCFGTIYCDGYVPWVGF